MTSRVRHLTQSGLRILSDVREPDDTISLTGGVPDPDTFPLDEVREATENVLARRGADTMQYGPTAGIPELRAWVAEGIAKETKKKVNPDQVIITAGSQQALQILANTVISPGDAVVVDDPCFPGALHTLHLAGAAVVGTPMDREGIRTDVLRHRLQHGVRPRMLYTNTPYHNPTGVTLSAKRREELALLAEEYGFMIVEDTAYRGLGFGPKPPPPISEVSDLVVSIGTMSKTIAPGFRVGWLVVPDELAPAVLRVKQAIDLQTSPFTQLVLTELVTTPGWLDKHLTNAINQYRLRCKTLCNGLRAHVGNQVGFMEPTGGLYIWVRSASPSVLAETLQAAARSVGVSFVTGAAFAPGGIDPAVFRLAFGAAPVDQLEMAAERLGEAFRLVEEGGTKAKKAATPARRARAAAV